MQKQEILKMPFIIKHLNVLMQKKKFHYLLYLRS